MSVAAIPSASTSWGSERSSWREDGVQRVQTRRPRISAAERATAGARSRKSRKNAVMLARPEMLRENWLSPSARLRADP